MAIQPYVVKTDCTVRGEFVRHGTLVDLDLADTALVGEYGGSGNLEPLPAGQTGDDADHGAVSD
jgi:hypothetical protein